MVKHCQFSQKLANKTIVDWKDNAFICKSYPWAQIPRVFGVNFL